MNMTEAQATFAYINTRYHGRIAAAIDDSHATADDHGYSIVLLLLAGQRRIVSPFVESIKSVLLAWEVAFLRTEPTPPVVPVAILEEQVVVDRHLPPSYECSNPKCICHKASK